ncbi:SUMF1/EgtB/PvdO family nonheme iron enzyme [Paenibacillus sp. MMS20-IR301]|uniref:SUMF1/EgtB/PvdO family nonheme iron enzyme n=1 Tax=Paenibacillus sp. MMS20-IR301 TaxID=2895946 RepID=UPI0028E90749|nr:SUMF1/EgtB/PvdO family nonheme iron enzyme [Paenibacillus sp. MMS20-IR301]WNS45563.1 SUMF1/EgtB/PvdO family nonheme iron enzyme [Paenibacillus sp. MMS20-IR301]
MQAWNRASWETLTTDEKKDAMQELLTQLPAGFRWLRMETFARYRQTLETGVFTFENSEFVFIPGDTVTLGREEPEVHPHAQMSPVREAVVSPMLVQRHPVAAGWYELPLEKLDPQEDAELIEEIEQFRHAPHSSLEVSQSYRLERDGGQVVLFLFDGSGTFEEWCEAELPAGFDLPDEDEWEYLYGAGTRTLFPWGDNIDESMRLRHVHVRSEIKDSRPYSLELPNAFGLCFPGDPYKKELVLTPGGMTGKGGDGGCNLHGGLGIHIGYLPTATAFRDPYESELDWTDLLDCLVYRRIVRLQEG